ncbi:MAG: hypothetical protein WCJ31_04415 [Planctomycetia bacterium]
MAFAPKRRRRDRDVESAPRPTVAGGFEKGSGEPIDDGPEAPDRFPSRADLVALATLLVTVTLAWCSAHGTWDAASWALPTSYPVAGNEDLEKSDVLGMFCYLKASGEGHLRPFLWKTIPNLGAPYEANWNDFPTLDEIPFFIDSLLARTFGLFAGLNVSMLLGHLLAAAVFFCVARWSSGTVLLSFIAALAFGLSPYAFQHGPHHMQVAYTWPIPLFLLVWRWVSTEPGIVPWSRRWWWAIAIGFTAGLHHVYYTNILCQLTLLGALIQYRHRRSLPALLSALAVIAAAAAAFVLMNLDTWTYKLAYGANDGAMVRDYQWLELYGLKIKDLFIPTLTHRSELLAGFSRSHRAVAPLLDERASYQGIVGLACLLWLAFEAVGAMLERRERDVPIEAWQVFWIVLMFTTGGLNAILGAAGFTLFRSGCRYSIVIMAITLLWAVRRGSTLERAMRIGRNPDAATLGIIGSAVIAACMVIVWDEVPRPPTKEEMATIVRQVDSDRTFTAKMEASLPEGAMVFQLPIMEFPEMPAPGVPPYDHFRPYLFSKNLRYSFGSMKGRPREAWQQELGKRSLEEAVTEIKKRGFAAIYINRNGFPDRALPVEKALRAMGYSKPPIVSATGDLVCIPLDKP